MIDRVHLFVLSHRSVWSMLEVALFETNYIHATSVPGAYETCFRHEMQHVDPNLHPNTNPNPNPTTLCDTILCDPMRFDPMRCDAMLAARRRR